MPEVRRQRALSVGGLMDARVSSTVADRRGRSIDPCLRCDAWASLRFGFCAPCRDALGILIVPLGDVRTDALDAQARAILGRRDGDGS